MGWGAAFAGGRACTVDGGEGVEEAEDGGGEEEDDDGGEEVGEGRWVHCLMGWGAVCGERVCLELRWMRLDGLMSRSFMAWVGCVRDRGRLRRLGDVLLNVRFLLIRCAWFCG